MKLLKFLRTRWVVWVWNHTPNCAEMSRLASRALDQPMSLRTRLQMRLHYLICAWCERYRKHLVFLHRSAPRFNDELDTIGTVQLSSEARTRMKLKLRNERSHEDAGPT